MSMSAELVFFCTLNEFQPKDVIAVIKTLIGEGRDNLQLLAKIAPDLVPAMLVGGKNSFRGDSYASFRYDKESKIYSLTLRTYIEYYHGGLPIILNWLAPYCEEGKEERQFVGYLRYWGDPILLYFEDGVVFQISPNEDGIWKEDVLR